MKNKNGFKENHYFTKATATDKDGVEHEIVIAGVWLQHKEQIDVIQKVSLEYGKNGNLTFQTNLTCKTLSLGYAICSAEDEFDYEIGKKIALRRAKKSPIGKVATVDFTMLNNDQCNALVMVEAMHIASNIDKYLPQKNN